MPVSGLPLCRAPDHRHTLGLLPDLVTAHALVPDLKGPHQARRVELHLHGQALYSPVELGPPDRLDRLLAFLGAMSSVTPSTAGPG